MFVGYARFNLAIELNFSTANISGLGTEYRIFIMHAWELQNIEFAVLSKIKQSDVSLFSQNTLFVDSLNFPFNTSKLVYEPEKIVRPEVLFIECGPTNTKFNGGEILRRLGQLVDKQIGRVIYYEHDITLPFPFEEFNRPYNNNVSSLNLRNLFSGIDPWKDKQWIHLSHIHPERLELFIDNKGIRYNYRKSQNRIQFKTIPLCYSELEPFYDPRENPKYDILYVGSERDKNRTNKLKKFIDNEKIKTTIIGRWTKKTQNKFEHVKFLGPKGKHKDVYKFYNSSLLSIVVADKFYEKVGQMQHRPIEIIRGGAIVVVDADIYGVDRYFDNEFIVNNATDVERWIKYLREATVEERKEIQQKQLKKFRQWKELDWKKILGG